MSPPLERQLPSRLSLILRESLLDEAPRIDKSNRLPPHLLEELKEEGFFAVCVPRELGGLGLGLSGLVELARLAARSCLTVSVIGVNHCVSSMLVYRSGGRASIEILPRMSTGELIASLAIEEDGFSEDSLAGIRTTYKQVDGYYLVSGEKPVCVGCAYSNLFLTLARRNHTFKVFLVGPDGGSVKTEEVPMPSLRGSGISMLRLSNARVPSNMVLEGDGLELAKDALRMARLGYAASSLGVVEGLLAHANAHLGGGQGRQSIRTAGYYFSKVYLGARSLKRLLLSIAIDSDVRGYVDFEESLAIKAMADQLLEDAIKMTVRTCGRGECLKHGGYTERMLRDSYLLEVMTGSIDASIDALLATVLRSGEITF